MAQVGPDVDEEVLIAAFKRHGRVTGHKLLRSSNCGFIDFEHVEDAASAREALHNFAFGSCDIRVEFKVCCSFMLCNFSLLPCHS